jgi:hypothetical protein
MSANRDVVDIRNIERALATNNVPDFCRYVVRHFVERLDGRSRFAYLDPQPTGDLTDVPENHLWALFTNDFLLDQVRQIIFSALGLYFVVDATRMTEFQIRLSRIEPEDNIEHGLGEKTRRYMSNAAPVAAFGDGIQAFIGIIAAVIAGQHKIILVDEPEAFLHPPMARQLGRILCQIARSRDASLIVATHSPDFVIGCLDAETALAIVRLEYLHGQAKAYGLNADDLSKMISDPLMRSSEIISGLFHNSAVVCEADSDRVYYDYINSRMQESDTGLENALFLNAQGLHTVGKLVRPLRNSGLPAAAICDFDALLPSSNALGMLMKACGVPNEVKQHILAERDEMHTASALLPITAQDKLGGHEFDQDGSYSKHTDRVRLPNLLANLAEYGLFIVPSGGLESWNMEAGIKGHGSSWVTDLFNRMAGEEAIRALVDTDKGPQKFLNSIREWVDNPVRLGMESV